MLIMHMSEEYMNRI